MTRRLPAREQLAVAAQGLAARRGRSALSALGISIGIAALVGVLGISESSRADLVDQLDRLGTGMLAVGPGQSAFGAEAVLPAEAPAMIARIATVEATAAVYAVDGHVRRTDRIPEAQTGGIAILAADPGLPGTVGATLAAGRWLDGLPSAAPAVVLGATAAERLGIHDLRGGRAVWLGGRWFEVVGILDPVVLADDLDAAALIGRDAGRELSAGEPDPARVYVRASEGAVEATRALLAPTASPAAPGEVAVSRPSDALAAAIAAKGAFTSLFLGLGAVVLLVGAIGVANVMVISVLERRREIGVRRALGATRADISAQFVMEAVLLSGTGGLLGAALGAAATAAFATMQGWTPQLPPPLLLAAVLVAVGVGAAAGVYPARRAARVPPTDALRSA